VIVYDMEQGSSEWLQVRLGKVTGTRAAALLAPARKGAAESAKAATLREELICERLTHEPAVTPYQNADMKRGIEQEPDAVLAYEVESGALVRRYGFIAHDTLAAGCSPDGIVGEFAGVIECKCPRSLTHLAYLREGTLPDEYRAQVLHAVWVTGAQWCDFVSFDPRFPPHLQLFILRVTPAPEELQHYELLLRLFLSTVDTDVAALLARAEPAA
jgi:hypothetical protein